MKEVNKNSGFVLAMVMVLASLFVQPSPAETSADRMTARVKSLTSVEMAGRGSGTAEADLAVELLASWMEEAGLTPGFDGSWYQSFPLKGQGWNGEELSGHQGRNLAGILPGHGPLANRYIVVGAHYDHLGRLEDVAPDQIPEPGQYYPGANDNASGLAALFELIDQAAGQEANASSRSILFLCFAAEEVGLQGSGHLVAHPPVPLELVDAMVNFDTIGQLTDNRLYVSGVGTAEELPGLVTEANTEDLDLSLAQGGWSGSDHMSFNTREVPVLFIFGGPYKQYNTPADTWDTLNYVGMARIASYTGRLVDALRGIENSLQWIMVAQSETGEGDETGQDRSSWLGTLPDFTEEVSGYQLAGVFDDSPAAKAGLMKGDVMTIMAGCQVTDLASFTRALRANSPGDLVEITVLRQGKPLNFTVVLGDRKNRK